MKKDFYSKFIQTVIAICLVVIVLRDADIVPKAYANGSSTQNYGLVPMNEDGSINVVLKSIAPESEMDVVITGIETSDEMEVDIEKISTSDELDVNIAEVGGHWVTGRTLDVDCD